MLIGVAALTAWGFYVFNQKVQQATAAIPPNATLFERLAAQGQLYLHAFAEMYGDIFKVTALICVVGALLGLLVSGRKEHAEEPEVPEQQPATNPAPLVER